MSRMLVEAVSLTRGIPHTPKCVLLVLATFAHHDGSQARPSQHTIADLMDLSPRSVRNGLAWLERNGYILPTGHDSGGRGCAVEYQISLAMLQNMAPRAAFSDDNPATDATFTPETRQNRTQNPARNDVNPANFAQNPARGAAQSGKNQKIESKERESAERAQRASASFVSSFENQKEARDQNPEQSIHTLLAPYDDNEWMALEGDAPLADERGVLLTLCAMTEEASPHRAWLQHVPTFLEAHATPDQLLIGFSMMREQFATMEHKPGVRKLAEHWDEWQSRAKAHIAKIIAEEAYFAEQQRRNLALEEAEERGREIRRAEQARRAALTPEERAQEDAENAAIEQAYKEQEARRHAERMAYMRAATAPRVVEVS